MRKTKIEDPHEDLIHRAKSKISSIPCPKCKDKNLFVTKYEVSEVRGRLCVSAFCFCQSCTNTGYILVHQVQPEELRKIEAINRKNKERGIKL